MSQWFRDLWNIRCHRIMKKSSSIFYICLPWWWHQTNTSTIHKLLPKPSHWSRQIFNYRRKISIQKMSFVLHLESTSFTLPSKYLLILMHRQKMLAQKKLNLQMQKCYWITFSSIPSASKYLLKITSYMVQVKYGIRMSFRTKRYTSIYRIHTSLDPLCSLPAWLMPLSIFLMNMRTKHRM